MFCGPFCSAAVLATVSVDGAMVYNRPDFDSKVIAYLHKGSKVTVSQKVFGAFRKVLVRKGLVGYISEVDVNAKGPGASSSHASPHDKKAKNKRPRPRLHRPVADTRWIGALLGYVNYREQIAGGKPAANLMTYGLKLTGPNILLRGPYLMDLNLAVHAGAPKYYEQGADVTPSGFLVMIDTPLLFPVGDSRDSMAYLGIGPLLTYSAFDVILQGQNFHLEEMKLGLSLLVGYGYRIGDAIARLEAKYFIEKTQYVGVQFGLQGAF